MPDDRPGGSSKTDCRELKSPKYRGRYSRITCGSRDTEDSPMAMKVLDDLIGHQKLTKYVT